MMKSTDDFLDEIFDMVAKIDRPHVGFVISSSDFNELKKEANYANPNNEKDKLFGIPVYHFNDVPKGESIAFKDREKLTNYLEMRTNGKTHWQALIELFEVEAFASPDSSHLDGN